ncbi:DUF1735 domain-containing protein [Bacteroides ovatus]|nr:DUF1735 domain-containing protein [Bacteroides ovatus]
MCLFARVPFLNGEISVRLKTWSDSELKAYNSNNGTNFQLLPEDLYQLEEMLTLKANEKQKV